MYLIVIKMKNSSNTVISYAYYRYLYNTSYFSLLSVIYVIFRGYNELVIVPGGVLITSILYWRYPTYSWRRTLDIYYVRLALLYQITKTYHAENFNLYLVSILLTVCFHPLSNYFYNKNKLWLSTYCHSMIHLFGNISNIILYMGRI